MKRAIFTTAILMSLVTAAAALPTTAVAADASTGEEATKATVFYFHGDFRCATCRSIEKVTKEVVHGEFAAELESGHLGWRIVNFDEDANEHYVKDVGLPGSSVVVARVDEDGTIRESKILQDVWRYSTSESKMRAYLSEQIGDYLDASR